MVRVSAQREVAIDDGSRVSGKPEVGGGCRYGAQGAGRDSVCVWIEQPIGATCAHYRALIADDEDRVAGRAGRWDRSQRIQVLGLARAGCDGPKHAIKAEQGAVVADSPDAGVFCAPQRVERFFGAAVDWRPALAIVTQQCAAVTDRPLGLAGNRENVIELGGGSEAVGRTSDVLIGASEFNFLVPRRPPSARVRRYAVLDATGATTLTRPHERLMLMVAHRIGDLSIYDPSGATTGRCCRERRNAADGLGRSVLFKAWQFT